MIYSYRSFTNITNFTLKAKKDFLNLNRQLKYCILYYFYITHVLFTYLLNYK